MTRIPVWLATQALIAQAMFAAGVQDVIEFNNGDRLTGVVASVDAKSVTFSNGHIPAAAFPWAEIKSVRFDRPVGVALDAAKGCSNNCPQKTIDVNHSTLSVIGAGDELAVAQPGGQAAYAHNVRIADVSGFESLSSAGKVCPGGLAGNTVIPLQIFKVQAAILSATQHQQTYGGDAYLLENWASQDCGFPHQRTSLDINPTYDEKKSGKSPPNITRNYDVAFQHLVFLKDNRFFLAFNGEAYHNNSLGVYLQQSYGGGFGALLGNLELGADLRHVGEHFYAPGRSVGFAASRLLEQYSLPLKFIGPKATLVESFRFIPAFDEPRAWQIRATVDVIIPIGKMFSLNINPMVDDYLRNAPNTFRRNYFRSTIGIAFSPVK